MNSSNGPGRTKTLFIACCGALVMASTALAETVMTVNGKPMEQELLDLYMQNRAQKPIDQLTLAEADSLKSELADLFVLSTIDLAKELEQDPAIAAQLDLQRMAVLSRFVAQNIAEDVEVSEEDITKAYEDYVKASPTEEYKARHILVPSQGEAINVIEALLEGADFAELAKERSTGPSGPNGGDLGWFAPNTMVRPFAEAVMRLENGRYTTDPVQTQFGWHVILREDSRAAEPPPMEGLRTQLDSQVRQEKLRAEIDRLKEASVQ
jgi:peptidyl-prolyl cis-trans isomerase C